MQNFCLQTNVNTIPDSKVEKPKSKEPKEPKSSKSKREKEEKKLAKKVSKAEKKAVDDHLHKYTFVIDTWSETYDDVLKKLGLEKIASGSASIWGGAYF